ncbi:hypothetical protein [Nitrosomonas ureae]|nr:hypothetical protein [Nitrosomonas ureae]
MYGDSMKGVMITLPKSFFNFQPFVPPPNVGMTVYDNIKFPVNWNEIFSDEYWLQMIFLYENWFSRKIQYVDNILEIFNRNIALTHDAEGREILSIKGLNTFASFKQKEWQFQSEYRFILCAFPPLVFPPDGFNNPGFVEKYSAHHINCIKSKNYPSIQYIDINIYDALNQAKFTLGPRGDKKDMSRLIALAKKYAPSATVCKSKLSNTIR